MARRFLIEVEGDFAHDTTESDLAMGVDVMLSQWGVEGVRDFNGEDGCLVTEVTGEHGEYAY